jgi:ZIP family zinc transporter
MAAAIGWGALAASSLLLGALLGLARRWPAHLVGLVLAFGAGALISAVSFELAEEGARIGGGSAVAWGLAVGAMTYFGLSQALARMGRRSARPGARVSAGPALALGAVLDGIPEQAVLGITLTTGEGVSLGLLVAVFVSNLPEVIGSATDMRAGGHRPGAIWRLWFAVAIVCVLATVGGYAIADEASGGFKAAINGFAAGALLVMLVDSMIPEAAEDAGSVAGLATVLGFALSAGLSGLSG